MRRVLIAVGKDITYSLLQRCFAKYLLGNLLIYNFTGRKMLQAVKHNHFEKLVSYGSSRATKHFA